MEGKATVTTENKPQRINEAGTYDVMIIDPRFELLEEKDGDKARMVCVLPGHTEDGRHIDARLFFTRQLISSGRNAGKPLYEVSAEKLFELGMERPFNPARLTQINNVCCSFVVEMEEYDGKVRASVKFINAHRREPISTDAAMAIWEQLAGGSAKPATASKKAPSSAKAEDDNPF